MTAIADHLSRVIALLHQQRDVIAGRVTQPEPPQWLQRRGWVEFLLGLSDDSVARCERLGLAEALAGDPALPPTLVALIAAVREATAMDPLHAGGPASTGEERRVSQRKRAQVNAVTALCRQALPAAGRVVDFGAGHGHLTRALRAGLGLDSLGLERDGDRVRTARELAGHDGPRFEQADAGAATATPHLRPGDLAVGLHACGSLGDALVRQAAGAGAHVVLVSCCPQKIPGATREPLSRTADHPVMHLRRDLLGLANVPLDTGAEPAVVVEAMAGREARHALRLLLATRGLSVEPGAEASGITRQRFRRGLAAVAPTACARRGLPAPSAQEIAAAERQARVDFPRMRRFSLPRKLLGRLLEAAVVLDRARFLEEQGYAVQVGAAFASHDSPRNLGIVGRAPGSGQ